MGGLGQLTAGRLINDATVWGRDDFPDDRSWVEPLPESLVADMQSNLSGLTRRQLVGSFFGGVGLYAVGLRQKGFGNFAIDIE